MCVCVAKIRSSTCNRAVEVIQKFVVVGFFFFPQQKVDVFKTVPGSRLFTELRWSVVGVGGGPRAKKKE